MDASFFIALLACTRNKKEAFSFLCYLIDFLVLIEFHPNIQLVISGFNRSSAFK